MASMLETSGLFYSDASGPHDVCMDAGYLYPHPGGCVHHGISYSEHALERMAPCTAEIVSILVARAIKRMNSATSHENIDFIDEESGFTTKVIMWWEKFCPKPRGILPEMVESYINDRYSTNVHVVTGADGMVVTVHWRHSNSADDEFAGNELILEARQQLKKHARIVESRQGVNQQTATSEPNVKAQREEMVGRVMKNVRKLTPSMDVKAKDWEKDMAKTKQKRNTKQIDMSIVKANKAIMKAAEKEAKNTPKTNNNSNMKVNFSKSQDVVSTAAAAGSDGDDTVAATNNADKVGTTVEVTTCDVAVVAQEAVVKAECDTTVPLSWEDFA